MSSYDQLDLLARPSDPPTSQAAGEAIRPHVAGMKLAILEQLAETLHATEAAVMLSGYPSALYDRLYADWDRIEWPVHVHSSNAVTAERGQRVEVLWANRPLVDTRPAALFDRSTA